MEERNRFKNDISYTRILLDGLHLYRGNTQPFSFD